MVEASGLPRRIHRIGAYSEHERRKGVIQILWARFPSRPKRVSRAPAPLTDGSTVMHARQIFIITLTGDRIQLVHLLFGKLRPIAVRRTGEDLSVA